MNHNKIIMLCLFLFFKISIQAQKTIELRLGQNFNGSGDTRGSVFGVEINKQKKGKKIVGVNITSTINDGSFDIRYVQPNGNVYKGYARYTTAGLQAGPQIGYNILKQTNKNQLYFIMGAFVRYQSSSYWEKITVVYPALSNLLLPVTFVEHYSPQRSYALGLCPQIKYNINLKNNYKMGFFTSFQADTQGDNIFQLGALFVMHLN